MRSRPGTVEETAPTALIDTRLCNTFSNILRAVSGALSGEKSIASRIERSILNMIIGRPVQAPFGGRDTSAIEVGAHYPTQHQAEPRQIVPKIPAMYR